MPETEKQSIDVLADALDQTADVLSAIPAEQLSDATHCGDWTVARLVAHVVAAPRNFLIMSGGGQPDWSAEPPLPDDWAGEFRSAADDLMRMWRRPTTRQPLRERTGRRRSSRSTAGTWCTPPVSPGISTRRSPSAPSAS